MNESESDRVFVMKTLDGLFHQMRISPNLFPKSVKVNFYQSNYKQDTMCFYYDDTEKVFTLPVVIDEILEYLKYYESLNELKLGPLFFYPSQQLLIYKDTRISLRHTHNKILYEIITNKNEGISKIILYKSIWPNDAEIFMNKLDTHLTNLKNFIGDKFKYEIKLKTNKGRLTVID